MEGKAEDQLQSGSGDKCKCTLALSGLAALTSLAVVAAEWSRSERAVRCGGAGEQDPA